MSEEDEGVSLTQAAPAVLQQFLFGVRDFFRSLFAAISVYIPLLHDIISCDRLEYWKAYRTPFPRSSHK